MFIVRLSATSKANKEVIEFIGDRIKLSTTNQTTFKNVQIRHKKIPHMHTTQIKFRILLHVTIIKHQQRI